MLTKKKPTTVGEVISEEYLAPLGLMVADLASVLNVHRNTLSAIINNKANLSLDMAMRLAKALNTSVEFWLNIDLYSIFSKQMESCPKG